LYRLILVSLGNYCVVCFAVANVDIYFVAPATLCLPQVSDARPKFALVVALEWVDKTAAIIIFVKICVVFHFLSFFVKDYLINPARLYKTPARRINIIFACNFYAIDSHGQARVFA
jgi:hypothetical protein